MEGISLKEKEMKRRFFRRTKRSQRSLDSSSPIPSHSPSLELNNSMFALATSSNPNSTTVVAPSSSFSSIGGVSGTSRAFGTARESNSLDETVINNTGRMDHQHRRFMAAPRRARSAERFEGMRVAFNSPGDEMHPRNLRGSPQLIRTGGGGGTLNDLGRGSGSGSQTPTMPMPSPPPPYASAVTDITGPPSYRQAVAAMTAQAQGIKANNTGNRYTMPHRGGTQSFDMGGYPTGTTTGLRSAASVPAFHADDIICNCSKCQALRRPNEMGYDNDAVYMESQAFLMHEIMTDGMAFCTIT